jgi:hypothetical protein
MVQHHKTIKVISLLVLISTTLGFISSCSKSNDVTEAAAINNREVLITQAQLDAVTFVSSPSDTSIIGNPFNDREPEARNNFRDIFQISQSQEL